MLGVLAGIVFIFAGLAAYFHFETGLSLALVFVIAGAAVVLIGVAGLKIRTWDLVLFIIGLIILANVVGFNYYQTTTSGTSSYYVSSSNISTSKIEILANSVLGGVDVHFSNNADFGYQVVFHNAFFGFPFLNFSGGESTVTNQTRDGVLYLNAAAQGSITITLGLKYEVSINATTTVGSIDMDSPAGVETNIKSISLVASTGSVEATFSSGNISGITMKTSTGSVNFESNYLSPSTAHVPISISSSTGSVNINMKIASDAAVGVDATSNLGSVNHHLTGFTISMSSNNHLVASSGSMGTSPKSFQITSSVGTGSINISGELVPPH